jgi:hypothetical protein
MSTLRRTIAIIAALVGAAAFATSVQGGNWWTIGDDVGVGTVSTQQCFGGACRFVGMAWTGGGAVWQRAGAATYAAGLCAAFVLLALAGALAAKRTGRLVAAVVGVAVITAGVAGATFYAKAPALPSAVVGRGVILFAVALAAAAAAAAITLTAPKPAS